MSFVQATALSEPTEAELQEFAKQSSSHENHITNTWEEQAHIEQCIFDLRHALPPLSTPTLHREKHTRWLLRSLHRFPRGFVSFDPLQGWAAFWILHALDLLDVRVPTELGQRVVKHFEKCKDKERGGYGGGPGQSAHMASTFSVFMALCALGTEEALKSVEVEGLNRFIRSMWRDKGAFQVSEGGEMDVRGCYCAVSVGSMVGMLDGEWGREVKVKCGAWLRSLQGFDGGMGGEPGAESHGGNTYCGYASAVILGVEKALDREKLLDWAVMRQMGYEGGFQGRTNKLVDSCYSFWVGGLFAMLGVHCFDAERLVRYVLECCQLDNGGLRDKPGMPRDFMHTCYALSGLSVAYNVGGAYLEGGIKEMNAVYHLSEEKFENAWRFFRGGS